MIEPPFSGTLEFKLGFRAFELSVVRDESAIYAYSTGARRLLATMRKYDDARSNLLRQQFDRCW